ncbi:Wall associated protein [Bacillus anthracis]|nr:Wall associated protein [Bacillus cereus]
MDLNPMNSILNETLPNGTSKSYIYEEFGNRTRLKVGENGKEKMFTTAIFNEGNQHVKFGNKSLTYDVNGNIKRFWHIKRKIMESILH